MKIDYMSIDEIKKKFPEDIKGLSDEQLEKYAYASEILSDLFINSLKRKYQKDTISIS